jgi:hypothetical protein
MAGIKMKRRRAYFLVAGAAMLNAVAAYIAIPGTTVQPTDRPATSGKADAQRTATRSPDAAVESPSSAGNPLWALPLKQLSITRDRPIFSPSRRPPPPATPTYIAPVAVRQTAKPAEPERPSITLIGTILGSTESIGVFFNPATRDIVRLRVGEDHEGWALRAVKTREVTLVKDREKVVLELPPPGDSAMSISDFTPDVRPPPARRPPRR